MTRADEYRHDFRGTGEKNQLHTGKSACATRPFDRVELLDRPRIHDTPRGRSVRLPDANRFERMRRTITRRCVHARRPSGKLNSQLFGPADKLTSIADAH